MALFSKAKRKFRLEGETPMPWLLLFLAGLLEIGWAVGLKYTKGFSELWPTIGTLAAMIASIGLLGIAMRTLPVGTAYAVWTGIGAVGTVLLGILLFGEFAGIARLACVGLILAGIIGLKLVGN
jgi:quaternary ammonium compound-resistance protein SugE